MCELAVSLLLGGKEELQAMLPTGRNSWALVIDHFPVKKDACPACPSDQGRTEKDFLLQAAPMPAGGKKVRAPREALGEILGHLAIYGFPGFR